jgi:hypothetical protein
VGKHGKTASGTMGFLFAIGLKGQLYRLILAKPYKNHGIMAVNLPHISSTCVPGTWLDSKLAHPYHPKRTGE